MRAVILDRDGVINADSPHYIKTAAEWHALPGSLAAIAQLNQAGFNVFVVTNQSGVARGLLDMAALNQIHQKFIAELTEHGGQVTEIFFCPHGPLEQCACRKPKPGMLLDIAKKYPVNLHETFFIGDTIHDIHAAQQAGCKPILVLTGKGKATLEEHLEINKDIKYFADLSAAVKYVLHG